MTVFIAGMNFISCYNAEVVVGTKINDAFFQLQFPESIAFPDPLKLSSVLFASKSNSR